MQSSLFVNTSGEGKITITPGSGTLFGAHTEYRKKYSKKNTQVFLPLNSDVEKIVIELEAADSLTQATLEQIWNKN